MAAEHHHEAADLYLSVGAPVGIKADSPNNLGLKVRLDMGVASLDIPGA